MTHSERRLPDIVRSVSVERLMEHTGMIAQWVRLSGSEDEAKSFDYIESVLRGLDLPVRRLSHDAYVSLPGKASLEWVASEGHQPIECITHAFGGSIEGLEAELVDVGAGGEADFGASAVRGKAVLCDGLAIPERVIRAKHHGAVALINVNGAEFHEMIVSPVWGSPTHETRQQLPDLPTLSVRDSGGGLLREALGKGRVEVRLCAEVRTEWRPIPLIETEIQGSGGGDGTFVLLAGHVDSWHFGAMDNGTANACQLEMARLFSENREGLRRSLRIVFWSGHSHARYAGSQWYVDTHYAELRERCAAYLFADSLGGRGMELLSEAPVMAELQSLARQVIADVSGQQLAGRRIRRAGDQSFWGVGLPAAYIYVSRVPVEANPMIASAVAEMAGRAATPAGTMAPWWHTVHDTIDKIDPDLLLRDTQVYAATLERLLCDATVPLDLGAMVEEFRREIGPLVSPTTTALGLEQLLGRLNELQAALERFDQAHGLRVADQEGVASVVNNTRLRVARHLIPVNYTRAGAFDHDPALVTPPFPLLDPLRALDDLPPDGDEARFVRVAARRGVNAVDTAISEAILELEAGTRALEGQRG